MAYQLILCFCLLLASQGCDAKKGKDQIVIQSPLGSQAASHLLSPNTNKTAETRPKRLVIPPVGPYFRELAEQASKASHAHDRFRLFKEMLDVWAFEGGDITFGCPPNSSAPDEGIYDNYDLARETLLALFQKGDAHAGYLLGGQSTVKEAYKRGDPYATVHVLWPRSLRTGERDPRTPEHLKQLDDALKQLEEMAGQGDREAMFRLALTTPLGAARANQWYEKLKERPDRLTYKAIYYKGAGGSYPRDGLLILEAAKHGEARGMAELANHFYYGNETFTGLPLTDLDQAWYWLRKFREAVGCPPPEVVPPIDRHTGKAWKKPTPQPATNQSQDRRSGDVGCP